MTLIIHGASGAQGAPVVATLLARGESPIAAVRDESSYSGTASAVSVDSSSVESLVTAYTGADAIFIHLPIGSGEQQLTQARAIVEAVQQVQPARVVVSTSGYPVDGPDGVQMPIGVLLEGLRASGVSLAVVTPKLFLENLLLPPVTSGVHDDAILRYPLRADYAVSWASHLDVAAGFSTHLGTSVAFEAQTPDAFGASIIPLFGEAGATPVVDSYRWRATQADEVIDADTSAQQRLGLTPRSVAQWLSDVSA